MRRYICVILLVTAESAGASNFDETLCWLSELPPGAVGEFNISPSSLAAKGIRASILHSRPYQIDDLSWNKASLGIGFGRWGVLEKFNDYSLEDYYQSYVISSKAAIEISERIVMGTYVDLNVEKFRGIDDFRRVNIGADLIYKIGNFAALGGVRGMNTSREYDDFQPFSRPWGAFSYNYRKDMSARISVRRFPNKRTRWLFDQSFRLSKQLGITIGFMDRPDVILGRIIIGSGPFSIDLTYLSIGRLKDTTIIGINFGSR